APAASKEEITLAEGGARENLAISATPNSPELALVLQREAFTLDEKVTLALRSFRVGMVDLALWQIPIARLGDGARDFRALATRVRGEARWESSIGTRGLGGGRCDTDGLLMLPFASPAPSVRVVAVSASHGVAVADAPLAPAERQAGEQAFLFTERPIYRPGQ